MIRRILHSYASIFFPLVQTCRFHCYLYFHYRIMSLCKYILHFVNKYNVSFLQSMQLPVIIENFGFCHCAMCNIPWKNMMSSLYDIHKCIVVIFILIFECVTVRKECAMNHMFQKINTLSSQSVTTQCACVTRDKKMLQKRTTVTLNRCSIRSVIVLQSSNTFFDLKEYISFVPID